MGLESVEEKRENSVVNSSEEYCLTYGCLTKVHWNKFTSLPKSESSVYQFFIVISQQQVLPASARAKIISHVIYLNAEHQLYTQHISPF